MLQDAMAISDATGRLQPHDFFLDSHQRIFKAIWGMAEEGQAVDQITVATALDSSGELGSIGGRAYLAFLTEDIPRGFNVESYVKIVKDKSVLRQIISMCKSGAMEAADQSLGAPEVLTLIEDQIRTLSHQATVGDFSTPVDIVKESSSIEEFLSGGSPQGTIPTGYAIDKMTNFFKPSQLIILAARPSMGKTAWALNIAANDVIRFDKSVGILSLEMDKASLLRRMVQSESRIPKHRFIAGLSDMERRRANEALEMLMDSKLHIEDTAFQTFQDIRSKARRLQQEKGLDFLIIDYLGLMEPPGKSENRTQEVSAMSRGLKGLAKELGIPVLALAQLNRECEKRADKRPMLSDLRDSGSIEQDADIVAFIYRQEVYEPKNTEVRGLAEINVAKQRDGPIGVLDMTFLNDITRFDDRAYEGDYHV
jgi:replicative DNA helicase